MRRYPVLVATLGLMACVSTQQEIQMGNDYAQQINAQLPIVNDAEVNRYLNALGDSIARVADDRNLTWRFYLVNSPEVNAFAVPGGHVYVNRGLVERTTTLSQLAGVLGHEIGHVTERHSAEQMEKAQGANLGLGLACILTSICSNQAAAAAIQIGAGATFAKFSRDDEREADEVGFRYVMRAGISPKGIPEMFRKLLDERQSGGAAVGGFFSTHPLEEERIQAAEQRLASVDPAILASLVEDTPAFQAFRKRVLALPAPPSGQ
ncbi:MAG TPA: M48 family metallopeptidase [Gemmatimonadaceae bacterium]|nr:M48 family metallopeptidase [Gemmatimonadaceae bacterium]